MRIIPLSSKIFSFTFELLDLNYVYKKGWISVLDFTDIHRLIDFITILAKYKASVHNIMTKTILQILCYSAVNCIFKLYYNFIYQVVQPWTLQNIKQCSNITKCHNVIDGQVFTKILICFTSWSLSLKLATIIFAIVLNFNCYLTFLKLFLTK